MEIKFENIILRDMIESDIEDYVRWFTVEREWENWDAPWEKEDTNEESERRSWTEYYESMKLLPDDKLRWKFEIEWNGRHIGWVSSYPIDENYEWVSEVKDDQTVYRAIGIDICEPDVWGKGVGTNALRAFINYYFENGVDELYTQTWSGNTRMIRCGAKLGFVECNRYVGIREVEGKTYDALTFRLEKRKMIIWISGPYGVGKSTLAEAMAAKMENALIFDAEEVGNAVRENYPDCPYGYIFEDYPLWGEFCYMLLKDVHEKFHKDILVPMTLLRSESYGIIEKLRRDGIDTRLVVLEASYQTVHDRILDHGEEEGCWCMENIELARSGCAVLPGIHIQTDGKTVDELCDKVLNQVQ